MTAGERRVVGRVHEGTTKASTDGADPAGRAAGALAVDRAGDAGIAERADDVDRPERAGRAGRAGRAAGLVAGALAVACAVLAVAAVAGRVVNRAVPVTTLMPDVVPGQSMLDAAAALLFAVPGWYLVRKRPDVAFGWLALAAGLSHGVAAVGLEWVVAARLGGHDLPAAWVGAWAAGWGPLVELVVLASAYALFPDGRWPAGRALRLASGLSIGLTAAGVALTVLDPYPLPGTSDPRVGDVRVPFGIGALEGLAESPEVLIAPGMILAATLVVVRWRRAEGEQRRVLSWLAPLAVVAVVVVPSVVFLPPAVGSAIGEGTTFIEVAVIVAAVLRHRVYGIDVVLNRTLVYGALTVVAGAVYGTAVAIGAAVGGASGWWSFVGALAVGLVLLPARVRVQQLVNRLLYGERDEPFAVVSRAASVLGAAGAPEALLAGFVGDVREALQVPYVAVRLDEPAGPVAPAGGSSDGSAGPAGEPGAGRDGSDRPSPPVFEAGERTDDAVAYPVVHRGRALGALVVGRRRGEAGVGPRERRLVEQLAAQVSVAAANLLLTADLRRSRQRVVAAREEERRRLRRDLHDGLGPQLTGVALGLDAAAERAERLRPELGADLDRLRGEVEEAIEDIRRLVRGLRPPRLDDVGFEAALEELAARTSRAGLRVHVRRGGTLPAIDTAVETAAYRIAAEAVTNAARHARARTCEIIVGERGGRLCLAVTDDGDGLPAGITVTGTGRASMLERAEELGGTLRVGAGPDGGCRVEADLPLRVTP